MKARKPDVRMRNGLMRGSVMGPASEAAKPEALAEGTRCACDSLPHDGHAVQNPEINLRCHSDASVVVLLRYPVLPRGDLSLPPYQPRTVRLPMCAPCAEWWTTHEHDGVTATLQVGSEVAR